MYELIMFLICLPVIILVIFFKMWDNSRDHQEERKRKRELKKSMKVGGEHYELLLKYEAALIAKNGHNFKDIVSQIRSHRIRGGLGLKKI